MNAAELKATIREIPDFPKPGIGFKDISTLLLNPDALATSIRLFADHYHGKKIDKVCGIESRGFIFGTGLALELGVGFITVRKPGKLPAATVSESYDLEYGSATIEVHTDAIQPGDNVLVIDDLLATGGTLAACAKLVERCQGKVAGIGVVVELAFLDGRKKLDPYDVFALVSYDSE